MSKFTRDQAENGNHNDSFFISLDYQFSHNSSYAMSFQNNSTRLTHQSEVNGFYFDIDSHYEFFSDYPQYGWLKNKGYGTKEHISAIHQFGISEYHRKSFLKNLNL